MRTVRGSLLLAATLGVMACGSSSADGNHSGIDGTVVVAPTCPVQRAGQVCSRPYATTLSILSAANRRQVARVRSHRDGRFRVSLPSGRYIVRGTHRGPPWSREVTVVVRRQHFTRIRIVFDSGIR